MAKFTACFLCIIVVCMCLPFLNAADPILAFDSFSSLVSIVSTPLQDTFNSMIDSNQITTVPEDILDQNYVYRVTRSNSLTKGEVKFERIGIDKFLDLGDVSFRYDGSTGYDWFFGSSSFLIPSDPLSVFEPLDIFNLTSKQPNVFYSLFPRAVFGDYFYHTFSSEETVLKLYFKSPSVLLSPSEWTKVITINLDNNHNRYLVYINKVDFSVTVIGGAA